MKTATRLVLFMLALTIMVMPAVACGEPTPPPTPSPPAPVPAPPAPKKITLADSPTVLDLSPLLPASFEHIDAASEGLSNEDIGLGPDFSEVELFLSEEPYQVIFAYLIIIESQVERATSDAFMKDKQQFESVVLGGLQEGAAEEGGELSNVEIEVTYPDVGDLAVLGSGTASAYGASTGYDMLIFKSNKVYVFIVSSYLPGESVPLAPLAKGIEQRIGMFSQ